MLIKDCLTQVVVTDRATYVAMGLSDDSLMGRDSVIECINFNNEIRIFTSVTNALPSNYGVRRNDVSNNFC
jgi:hypothetical protein